jgi:hypothetical protein
MKEIILNSVVEGDNVIIRKKGKMIEFLVSCDNVGFIVKIKKEKLKEFLDDRD